MGFLLAEEYTQGTIEAHSEKGMLLIEQHTQRALSIVFPFGRNEGARNMLRRQEISERNLSLAEHAARVLGVEDWEMGATIDRSCGKCTRYMNLKPLVESHTCVGLAC
jgi:hypothetical protein